jgi:SAM-dependent methyltransferase
VNAFDWNQHYLADHEPWTVPDPVLIAEAERLATGRALELGSGEGADGLWLAEQGWQVTCIDSAPAAIATVERLAHDRGLSVCGLTADVTSYRAAASFDLVFMCYLHLDRGDRARALANACTMLAPGATFIYIGIARAAGDLDASFYPGPDEVASELTEVDIEVARAEQRTVHCPEGPFECSGGLVRARRNTAPPQTCLKPGSSR